MMASVSTRRKQEENSDGHYTTALLSINGMEYDENRPGLLLKNKLALIHVVLHSLVIVASPTSNDGLSVNREQARGKQRWALQQLHYCELTTWSMINIDLLSFLKISWSKQEENRVWHDSNPHIVN
jgi:hypothetical protein